MALVLREGLSPLFATCSFNWKYLVVKSGISYMQNIDSAKKGQFLMHHCIMIMHFLILLKDDNFVSCWKTLFLKKIKWGICLK